MAFDGLVVRALAQELHEKLEGARLDKVYQPDSDELLLCFHSPGGVYKLTLSANASIPRVSLTEKTKENPMVAPMFCMLLRKHLTSAHLLEVRQPDLDRLLFFDFDCRNELGDKVKKSLVIEIMGRHSNIILVDELGRVADSIKRVDFSVSSKRQILPGLPYELPPAQDKINPLTAGIEDMTNALSDVLETDRLDKVILSKFQGISPLISREVAFLATGETETNCKDFTYDKKLSVATALFSLLGDLKSGKSTPCFLQDKETGKLLEFSAVPILQYGNGVSLHQRESMAFLIGEFYQERSTKEHIARRGADLLKIVSLNTDRLAKKIERLWADLNDTEKRETYREYGELITANLYQIEKGVENIRVQNYFDENLPMVVIPLDNTLTPAQNAQKYFKKYTKAKTASVELSNQLKIATEDLAYLESVEEALSRAESTQDLSQIAEELASQGYVRKRMDNKRKKEEKTMPQKMQTSDGFTLYAGKNNRQNDYLTCKMAQNKDLWFHTKDIPGSHVVLKYEEDRPFTNTAIEEAACHAAFSSKGKQADKVPVDYTEIKYVKKPAGAKPGFVVYTTYQTVYVKPKELKIGM